MNSDKFDNYINTHPREALRFLVVGFFLIWQTIPAIFGVVFYLVLKRFFHLEWWITLSLGIITAIIVVSFQQYFSISHFNIVKYVNEGFSLNLSFWRHVIAEGGNNTFSFFYHNQLHYIFGFPLLISGILSTINLIPSNPHENSMLALKKGEHENVMPELSTKEIDASLKKLSEKDYDGTVLGVSKYTGKYSVIPDQDINQVLLVLGTTGSGKTITLRRFYQRAITKGYPLIVVDGKPDNDNINWLMKLANQHGREFFGFNCGNNLPYDPLANGGYTELKDKIISLKDEWSSDYYRSIAEDYLQTTFEVLLKSEKDFDLNRVVECLNYDDLAILVRETQDEKLMKRVSSLEHYDRKDITGLQAHLNILIHSELGKYFEKNEMTFTLSDAIHQNAVVYFALPALRFPSFSKVLGKLVINDLKAVIDQNSISSKRIFTVFDEFSVFAGEQVLNLVNMGRGKGVHAIFGTQGLADLDKVDVAFKNQIMNCVNTIVCHRLNDKESAESVANWVGTKNTFTVTAQINTKEGDASMGSVRRNKEFIVHPDAIKQQLQVGEVFYITKVARFLQDKIKIKYA